MKRISASFTSPAMNAVRGRSSLPEPSTSRIRAPTTATSGQRVEDGQLSLEALRERPVVGVLYRDTGDTASAIPRLRLFEMPMWSSCR